MHKLKSRERKQSLNRPSEVASPPRLAKQRSCSSHHKRTNQSSYQPAEPAHHLFTIDFSTSTLSALPFAPVPGAAFAIGQNHIVAINGRSEAIGAGDSAFGQLGFEPAHQNDRRKGVQVWGSRKFVSVFCTPFCTFLINRCGEVFACGLNNRGQLGMGHSEPVFLPVLVPTLSPFFTKQTASSRGLSSHLMPNQLQTEGDLCHQGGNSLAELGRVGRQELSASLLCLGEGVEAIVGGPFHTAVLTSNGRVFYSGNIYKKSSVINSESAFEFAELNVRKVGKVIKIKASLTGLGLLNTQGSLFLLGALTSTTVCDEPLNVGVSSICDFSFAEDRVYLTTEIGEVFVAICSDQKPVVIKLEDMSGKRFKNVQSGIGFCYFWNHRKEIYSYFQAPKEASFWEDSEDRPACYESSKIYLPQSPSHIKASTTRLLIAFDRKPLLEAERGQGQDNVASERSGNKDMKGWNKDVKGWKEEGDEGQKREGKQKEGGQKREMKQKFAITNNVTAGLLHKARAFDPSMEIAFSELKLGPQISEGGYGVIYRATWRKTTVAVKIFKIDHQNENSIKDFISECQAMDALRHPNIVMFLGACTKPPHFAIVLEYCPGGTLWSMLQSKSRPDIPWKDRLNLALDTARAVNYLHERKQPILHRDLKSLNLLIDSNNHVKLADFGWTKGLENYMTSKIGTYQWMAPEVISSHKYTEKADVFSFGIILWEIASREAPYRNIPGVQVAQDVLHKGLRPTIPKGTPPTFSDLIERCWAQRPDKRPSFVEIIEELQLMSMEKIAAL